MSRYKEILHFAWRNGDSEFILDILFSELCAFRSSPRFKGGLCRQNCLWSYFFGPAGRKYKSCQHFYRSICRQEILFMIKKKLQVGHLLGRLLEIFLSSWKWHCSGIGHNNINNFVSANKLNFCSIYTNCLCYYSDNSAPNNIFASTLEKFLTV